MDTAMIEPEDVRAPTEDEMESMRTRNPLGALILAGIGAFVVFVIWLLFYLLVFLPRGVLQ
jgi:hypothetical protein